MKPQQVLSAPTFSGNDPCLILHTGSGSGPSVTCKAHANAITPSPPSGANLIVTSLSGVGLVEQLMGPICEKS